jgi:thiamine-phosphate pyrophosphorylase
MHTNFLKKYYFIDKFEKSNIDKQDINTTIIYRNYKKNYKINEIIFIKNYCKIKKIKFLISNNIKLSIKLNLDGAYLPSFNRNFDHLSYHFKRDFLLIGSAHNLKEIRIKEKQKVNKIFLSSIFKKNNNYLGINKFNLISRFSNSDVIALGGVSRENIKLINLTKSKGFAGISFFR